MDARCRAGLGTDAAKKTFGVVDHKTGCHETFSPFDLFAIDVYATGGAIPRTGIAGDAELDFIAMKTARTLGQHQWQFWIFELLGEGSSSLAV